MRGTPEKMQESPKYFDLIGEIKDGLRFSAEEAFKAGVKRGLVAIDPGIGFGKTVWHNLEILNRLEEFKDLGLPLCIGTSRKSFLGKLLDLPDAQDRLTGTITTCVIAVMKGARILRVHDVKAVRDAVTVTEKILRAKKN
ncbi:MAG: dihydropteroate synthase, partial [Candidatus Omnitrophica bacterium]|nr:dihydropteroate synthase [Candidatus Omnitrophota bacterium]